jgi:Na+-driven multidrug efflux pump
MAYFLDGTAHAGSVLIAEHKGKNHTKEILPTSIKAIVINTIIITIFILFGFTQTEFVFDFYHVPTDVITLFSSFIIIYFITAFMGSIAFTLDGIYIGLEKAVFLRNVLAIATIFGFIGYLTITDEQQIQDVWTAFMIWMIIRAMLPLGQLLRTYKWN